jgi:arylsulfatase A-like enzyme/dienelactone hydrolase
MRADHGPLAGARKSNGIRWTPDAGAAEMAACPAALSGPNRRGRGIDTDGGLDSGRLHVREEASNVDRFLAGIRKPQLRVRHPRPPAIAWHAGLAVLLALAPRPAAVAAARNEMRPNILFIFSDDHGAQAIGAYGSNRNRTPSIDRLAREGMRFDDCFCGNSICAPSRATILTGLHSHVTGHTSNERIFDNRATTFPELLHDAGYQTALIGKWHLNVEPQGFDDWDILINQGTYYNPDMIRNGQFHRETGYTTDILTDLTIDWLKRRRDPSRPFLLLSQHKAPHRSWEPALRHLALYEDSLLPEPPTLFDDWANRSSAHTHAHMSIEHDLWPGDLHLEPMTWLLTPAQEAVWDSFYVPRTRAFRAANLGGRALVEWKYQRYVKDYLRCVAALDEDIGRLLDYLDASGLARNTIVIYSSDQGWYLGEHGLFDKRWMYEESFRMPFLVRWPGVVRPGSVNRDLVQNIDFAPTLLDAAHVPVPVAMQGRSLVPLLEGRRPQDWRRSLYYQFYEDLGAHGVPRHCGVRTDRYAYIDFYRLGEQEMFDLAKDPLEVTSVADDPAYRPARDSLERELRRLQKRYRVSTEADSEYTRFEGYQHRRWALMDSIGRMPPFGQFMAETLSTRSLPGRDEFSITYRIGGQTVPARLYVPKHGSGLRPGAVLVPDALGPAAFSGATLDSAAVALCRRGFVVVAPERFAHGLRASATGAVVDERRFADAVRRFEATGPPLLAQEIAELWFAHAYLERLEGVHMLRVGVLGFGEGGDLALLLAALDPEVAAAACVGGSDSFEQAAGHPFPAAARLAAPAIRGWGNLGDVIPLVQPRPLLLVGGKNPRPAWLGEGDAWYGEHRMAERLAYRSQPGLVNAAGTAGVDRAVDWLTRWLPNP